MGWLQVCEKCENLCRCVQFGLEEREGGHSLVNSEGDAGVLGNEELFGCGEESLVVVGERISCRFSAIMKLTFGSCIAGMLQITP